MRRVEFYRHNLGPGDADGVARVLDSLFLTTGQATEEFEQRFAALLQAEHAVALTSCTAALHLALLGLGVRRGDEVITTPMTFVATANAILHASASPVFADVEPETGNLSPEQVERAITPRTKAIIAVHLYGQMCDMRALRAIADRHGLVLVEDAAHALEATRDGLRPGRLSDAACFSFYATKSVTSGEGGALVTDNSALALRVKKLRLHGIDADAANRYHQRYRHWDMEEYGWKYNMDNIHAALLLPQLERIEERWRRREEIARRYEAAFSGIEGVTFPRVLPGSRSGRHLFTIWVDAGERDDVLARLQDTGIGVAVNYRAVHLLRYYRQTYGYREGMFPVAEDIGNRTISLPLYPRLTDDEVAYVINGVRHGVGRPRRLPQA